MAAERKIASSIIRLVMAFSFCPGIRRLSPGLARPDSRDRK